MCISTSSDDSRPLHCRQLCTQLSLLVLWETFSCSKLSCLASMIWHFTLAKNVKQTNFVFNVALATAWPASKIAQTWLSRLLFTVNKMSEGNWAQFYLTPLDKRNCAPNWGTPLTLRVITFHYLGHSLPLPAMALSTPPLGDFRWTEDCSWCACTADKCRLETAARLQLCALRATVLCNSVHKAGRISQPAFKPTPGYRPSKISAALCSLRAHCALHKISQVPRPAWSQVPQPAF